MHGPNLSGSKPDLRIFRTYQKRKLENGELAVSAYGHRDGKCLTAEELCHVYKQKHKRVGASHGVLRDCIKYFAILTIPFRLSLQLHAN